MARKGKNPIEHVMQKNNLNIQHVNNTFVFMFLCIKNKPNCRTRFFDDRNHSNNIEKKICNLSN